MADMSRGDEASYAADDYDQEEAYDAAVAADLAVTISERFVNIVTELTGLQAAVAAAGVTDDATLAAELADARTEIARWQDRAAEANRHASEAGAAQLHAEHAYQGALHLLDQRNQEMQRWLDLWREERRGVLPIAEGADLEGWQPVLYEPTGLGYRDEKRQDSLGRWWLLEYQGD
jgi:hypothetical protein